MDITERIRYLCGLEGISVTKLEAELEFGNGSLTKHKGIKSDRLLKLARHFNVSMEYLLTGEDSSRSPYYKITPHEYEIILAYRKADDIDKRSVDKVIG